MATQVKLDLTPQDNVILTVGKDGMEVKLSFRPFTITDEKWLVDYLDGEDLQNIKLLGALMHQIEPESIGKFETMLNIELKKYFDNKDYDGIAVQLSDIVLAHGFQPFVQCMIILRNASLPDSDGLTPSAKTQKKTFGIWTLTFVWLCAFTVGFLFCHQYSDLLRNSLNL